MQKYMYYCLIALMLAGCAGAPAPSGARMGQTGGAASPTSKSDKGTVMTQPSDMAPPTTGTGATPTGDTTKDDSAAAVDDEVLAYFEEVALSGFEFGTAPEVAYKWTHDVDVSFSGALTQADRTVIDDVIADLNELIAPRQVNLVSDGGDITVWYGPSEEFSKRLSSYTPGNLGYFSIRYGRDYSITSATILIASEIDVAARAHLLREELTQSLGFFQDSRQDPLSIFQQKWTLTQDYSDLDRAIIPLLYDERVKPGMSPKQVIGIFS